MQMMTRKFSVLITGTLLGAVAAEDLAEEISGTTHCGSHGVLVPGVQVWQDVTVTPSASGDPDAVTVTAELLGTDTVPMGEYAGQEVTEEFVTEYLMGAGDFLLGAGDTFSPDSVTVVALVVTH